MDPVTVDSAPRKSNWWGRNWKWFVPTGCLTFVLMVAGFVTFLVMVIFGAMKSSAVYKDALAKARTNLAVIDALGSPIQDGMFLSGNTNVNGASGEANLAIPVSGPKGKATIYVVASKSAGQWNYTTLVAEIEKTHERIDLIGTGPQKLPPPAP